MDTKFQTSFIPKKPITAASSIRPSSGSSGGGLFTLFGILVFILSIAGGGFAVFWNNHLVQIGQSYQTTLTANENEFNPTVIQMLNRVNMKISSAKNLLANHLAPDAIFNIIGQLTAEDISFSTLTYTAPTPTNTYATLSMTGVGTSFSAIAFQSDVFGASAQYGENIALKDPVLSGLNVGQNGNVSFSFTTELDPANLLYSKILAASLGGSNVQSASPASTTP